MQASAVTLTLTPGDQLNLAISNTNPNMIVGPGDRVGNISSAAGMLADKKNTKAGAVFFSSPSDNSKPFTFFVETELGQVFSVNAAPRKGEGRSYRLMPATQTARPLAKAWESALPYESMLIDLNRALMQGVMPEGYGPATIDKELPLSASGLYATPDAAWVGNAL
ncbi:TraK domain-containing protein, partial [Aeromonas veronii]|uniref:TraK domain-containing protein n=1 Tax=Aeromonas veronii TaxID=654 RepID=UPI003F67C57D